MPNNSDEIKAKADSFQWYKRDPRAFYDSTRQLSLEARGAYNDLLDLIYIHNGPLHDDDKFISHALFISARKWRTLKIELLEAEKIICEDGKISNSRASIELEKRANQSRTNAENGAKSRRKVAEKNTKCNEINDIEKRPLSHARPREELELELEEEEEKKPASFLIDLETVGERIWRATDGRMMDDHQSLDPVMSWLRSGADLEADILPTIRAVASKRQPESIEHYGYFHHAIQEAIQDRQAGRQNRYAAIAPVDPEEYTARILAEQSKFVTEAAHGTA